MIDVEKYGQILDAGLLLDHYMLLCNVRDGREIIKSKRTQGFINLLCKRGYIEDGVLTDIAYVLIDGELTEASEKSKPSMIVKFIGDNERIENEGKFDYATWVICLHRECENYIMKATGKKQVRDKIEGVPYAFLPNPTDLGKVILRAVNAYKLRDFDKIEKCILQYVSNCSKRGKWFPILGYYIMKKNTSTMVTDMDSMDDDLDEIQDSTVNI